MKKGVKIFLLFITVFIIFAIIFSIIILSYYNKYYKNYNYVQTNKRESSIIKMADNTYLDSYISKKKNTLVIFWASWCPSCKMESEALNNFILKQPNIPVIIVSHDKDYETLNNYLNINNYNWFVILDSEKTIREHIAPNTSGIPCAYLINTNGNIINYYKATFTEDMFLKFYNLENLDNIE